MQRHLHVVRPLKPRPAKVVQLEARREARAEQQLHVYVPRPPYRPAA
jgi:hypothetical protein